MSELHGNNIKAIRKAKGISQGGLASAIGTSRQGLSGLERGTWTPAFATLVRLLQALDSTFEDVFPSLVSQKGGGE